MIQRPNAVNLIVCQQAIVEEGTRNTTLVNCFIRQYFPEFPADTGPFVACATLTDGLGNWTLNLVVSRPDTLDDVYIQSRELTFTDPLRLVRLLVPVSGIELPVPGRYTIMLTIEDEVIAQCVLEMIELGESQ